MLVPVASPLVGSVAVIVVLPMARLVARPGDVEALLIVATGSTDEVQVTAAVRSCVVLSLNVPVATYCWP